MWSRGNGQRHERHLCSFLLTRRAESTTTKAELGEKRSWPGKGKKHGFYSISHPGLTEPVVVQLAKSQACLLTQVSEKAAL